MSEPGAPPKLLLLGWDSQDNHKVDVRQVIVEQRFKLTTTALRPGGPVRAVYFASEFAHGLRRGDGPSLAAREGSFRRVNNC